MTEETKNNGQPEGGIYELSAYLPKLVVCANSAYINELGDIA